MNNTIEKTGGGQRWRTYMVAAAFALPAVVCWLFARTFVLPKLIAVWILNVVVFLAMTYLSISWAILGPMLRHP